MSVGVDVGSGVTVATGTTVSVGVAAGAWITGTQEVNSRIVKLINKDRLILSLG